MPPPLDEQAITFATQMTDLVAAVLTDEVAITASRVNFDSGPVFLVGNRVADRGYQSPISALSGDRIPVPDMDRVSISAEWKFGRSSSGEWIKALWSQFGLWVTNAAGKPNPFIRVEVDPNKRPGSWLVAHINISGESQILGQIYGIRGMPYRPLQKLHLPVGGFRYRPCFEDFLEFAIDEELIPGLDGWRETLERHRDTYRRSQLRSLVRAYPDIAREALAGDAHEPLE